MGQLLDRMVKRAVPPNLADPEQERIAAEAAENGIRSVTWLIAFPCLIVLVVSGFLAARGVQFTSQPSPPNGAASQAARELSSENAQLRVSADTLQRTIDELTKEREVLYGRIVDLQRRIGDAGAPQQVSATQSAPPEEASQTAPKETPTASAQRESQPAQAHAGPAAQTPPRSKSAASSGTADARPAKEAPHAQVASVKPDAPPPTKAPQPHTAPAARPQLTAAPPGYKCRDGQTVNNAAECERSVVESAKMQAAGWSSAATATGAQPAGPRPQFVVEFRQEVPGGPALPGQTVVVNFYDTARTVINSTSWQTNTQGRTPVFSAPSGTAYFQVVGPEDVSYTYPGNGHTLEVHPSSIDAAKGLAIVRFVTR